MKHLQGKEVPNFPLALRITSFPLAKNTPCQPPTKHWANFARWKLEPEEGFYDHNGIWAWISRSYDGSVLLGFILLKSCFFKVYIWQQFQLFLSQDSWGFITVHMLIMFAVSDDDEENVTHNSQLCDMHQICWMFSCYSMGSSNHLEHIDNFLRVCSLMLQYHVAAARIAWQMGRGNTKRKSVTRESQFSIGNFRVFRSDKDHTTRLAPFTNGHNCQAFQKRKTIWDGFLLGNPKTDLTSLLSFLAVSLVRYYPRPSKTSWTFYKGPQCLHSEKCIRWLLAVSFMFIQAVSCWTYIVS